MTRRWVLMGSILSIMIAWAMAQPSVTVQGTLKGYFLTPQGELVRRSITLTSSPLNEPPKEKLHLLWAGYYFEGLLESNEPVVGVRIFLGDVLIYPRRFPKPTTKVALPDWKIPLRIHPRYGFPPVVEVEWERGQRSWITMQPTGVKVLPLLPLKIDWIDLIRIDLVRRFLKREGDNFFPDWRADRITFVLQGEDGQAVWINPSKPPKGTKQYKGPCPLNARIYVGKLPKVLEPEGDGLTTTVFGYPIVVLKYRPDWFGLPEYPSTQGRYEFSALMRVGTIFHETLHAAIFRLLPQPNYEAKVTVPWLLDDFPYLYAQTWMLIPEWITQLPEWIAHQKAGGTVQQTFQKFLAARAALRQQAAEAMAYADDRSLGEGLATYLKELALKRFLQSPEGRILRQLDPYFPRRGDYTPSFLRPEVRLFAWMDRLNIDWRKEALRKKSLAVIDDLLTNIVGRGELTEGENLLRQWRAIPDETQKVREWGWEEFQAYLRGERIAFWVRVDFASTDELKNRQMKEILKKMLRETAKKWSWVLPMELAEFSIYRPCLVSHRTLNPPLLAEFGFFLRPNEPVWVRWRGHDLELKAEGVSLYVPNAQIRMSQRCVWLRGTLPVPEDEKSTQFKDVPKMRKAWMLFTPLMLLMLAKAGHSQPEGVTVTATIAGLFYDALTGQQQYLTLDLEDPANNPPGDWHTIAGETYKWNFSVTDTESRLAELTLLDEQGNVLVQKTADPPTNKLEATDERPVAYSCRPVKGAGWEIDIRLFPPQIRVRIRKGHEEVPVQSGKFIAVTVDPSGNRLPYTMVIVEGGGEIRGSATDENGEWWTYLTPGVNYSVRAGGSGLGAPSLCWRGPFEFKLKEREDYRITFMLWRH